MEYHIEHHMFPQVPSWNLPKLHAMIKDQMPPDKARKFEPGFIEVECYRFFGHARMDKSPYRSEEEETKMRKSDPISYASDQMLKNKIMNED